MTPSPGRPATAPWLAAQVKPNCLAIATRNLERQGFVAFSPELRHTVRCKDSFKIATEPLFPGYLFVGVGPGAASWQAINSTRGVLKLVTFGRDGAPARVPAELIESLRESGDGGEPFPLAHQPGAKVRIVNGPFADFRAVVESLAPQQRVWVLLDVMGKATRVCVDAGDVTPAAAART